MKRHTYTDRFFLNLFFVLILLLSGSAWAAERKVLVAVRTGRPPVIDGTMRDQAWQQANVAGGFHQYEPHNDRPATYDTRVRVLYDDNALYIAARLYDQSPDSILRELGLRNSGNDLNADRFYVDINPFDDVIHGFRFQVSASGVQTDANMSGSGRHGDLNWNAVWISEVGITDDGWIVEMEIPYSALRFPRGDIQEWGINFWREIRRTRETSSWNYVNRSVGDDLAYMGQLNGINEVSPPPRLSFYPYLSNYVEKNGFDRGWGNSFNGGMDLKYGLSPAFTMDVTLVPDFGQVQSDAKVLNLTPFEVRYDENRQFFTEGTELFQKGALFYSRRIGERPVSYHKAYSERKAHEVVLDNPLETRMINATKISGRTAGGLGIGLFNAMTAASTATLADTLTGLTRKVTTQPFTNYNLVVFDQSLRNNSYLSLINTNVAGSEKGYTANVTGTEFRFANRTNEYRISGSGALSQQYYSDSDNVYGFQYDLQAGKTGGTWRYYYTRKVLSNDYDQNDMGFLLRNNRADDGFTVSHHIFDPFWRFWMLTNSFTYTYSRLFEPSRYTGTELSHHLMVMFDTRFHISLRTTYMPRGERDYYEPRVNGRYYRTDEQLSFRMTYSSDYRRRVFVDGRFHYDMQQSAEQKEMRGFMIQPTVRVSDRLNMSYGFEFSERVNDIGYVSHSSPDSVFFGRRQSPTVINTFRSTYIFSNDLSLDFNLRHYWSEVDYDGQYYLLQATGIAEPVQKDLKTPGINYNAFTIDMLLTWHFAPGSQMTIAWKNVIDHRENILRQGYLDNLQHMFTHPQINSLSLRVLYYIDFQTVQRLNEQLRG